MKNSHGFSLVELLIAMAVSAIVSGAIYAAYLTDNRSYIVQDNIAEVQQNIRIAANDLERAIRMAGYDRNQSAGAGFVSNFPSPWDTYGATTGSQNIAFTSDINENGSIDLNDTELIAYRLNGNDLQVFSTSTGFVYWQTIAENIENLEFNYILDDGSSTTSPSAAQLSRIRVVQISILGRVRQQDSNFTNTKVYRTASGATWGPYNDGFRRRLLIATIKCRNLGL